MNDQSLTPTPPEQPPERADRQAARNQQELDPAGQALAEALRICFRILKVVMLAIVVIFIISGFYKVEQNEQAIVLRFGKVIGTGPSAILTAGWHWKWPEPINEVIKIPSLEELDLEVDDFWYYQTEQEKMGLRPGYPGPTLQFVRDGYNLTASASDATFSLNNNQEGAGGPLTDYNLVHSRWLIKYSITEPIAFVENLWDGSETGWRQVEFFLRNLLAEAVIITCANRDIDWIVWKAPRQFSDDVQLRLSQRLNELNVGITATLDLVDKTPPRQVEPAFNMATSARSQKKTQITTANTAKVDILSTADSEAQIQIGNAEARRTSLVEAARSDEQYLEKVVQGIRDIARNRVPDDAADVEAKRQAIIDQLLAVTVDQLYQETIRTVIAGADETFVLNTEGESVEWRPSLGRDATLKKKSLEQQSSQ